jgi:non-specific serine/threonine protein kinase
LLLPRNQHASAATGGKIYVIGGRVSSAFIETSNNVDLVEAYDPATDRWSARMRMPTARSAIAAGVYGSFIIVPGGARQGQRADGAFDKVEAYDTAGDTWLILPAMPHQRQDLALGVIGNRLYAVGGSVEQSSNIGIVVSIGDFNEALTLREVLVK